MLRCWGHFLLIIILCRLKCASWASWLRVDAAVKCCRGLHSQFLAILCNFAQIMLLPLSLVTTAVTSHVSRLAAPAHVLVFLVEDRDFFQEGSCNGMNIKVHTVTNMWEIFNQTRNMWDVIWIANEKIKLDFSRSKLMRGGEKIQNWGTLSCSSVIPK